MTRVCFASLLMALAPWVSLFSQEPLPKVSLYDVADVISIPIYPRVAAASGQSGDLVVKLEVDPNGHSKVMSIDGTSKFLVEAVRKKFTGWMFLPRKETYDIVISVSFQLLPSTAKNSELVSEVFPKLNKIIIRSRQPQVENGLIVDPPVLKNQ